MVPLGSMGTPQASDSPPPPRGLLDLRGPLTRGGLLKGDIAHKMAMDAIDRFRDCYQGPGTEAQSWTRAAKESFEDNSLKREEGMSALFVANFWKVFSALDPGPAVDAIDNRPGDLVSKLATTFTFLFSKLP